MDSIMHIPDLLQHVFEFLTDSRTRTYSGLQPLLSVNKSFGVTMRRWPAFMKTLSLRMEDGGSEVARIRTSPRRPTRVAYVAMDVVRLSAGKLVNLKLGNLWGERHHKHLLSNRNLANIVKSSPRLQSLHIQINTKFTQKGLRVLNELRDLVSLELPGRRAAVWPAFTRITKLGVYGRLWSLTNTQPNVKQLNIKGVKGISYTDLRQLGAVFPRVTTMGMYRCTSSKPQHHPCLITSSTPTCDFLSRIRVLHVSTSELICKEVMLDGQLFSRVFPKVCRLATNHAISSDTRGCPSCTQHPCAVRRCDTCMRDAYHGVRWIIQIK